MKVGDLVRLRNHVNPNAWGIILEEAWGQLINGEETDPEQKFMVLWSPGFQKLHGKEKWLCAARWIEMLSESR